jgi:pimeloyl-ACP methyl ester carboxylesterase
MQEVMERKGNIVHLSADAEDNKPVLVLLHGATADPSEMMEIARQWKKEYDVFLFSYNYHEPVRKVASEFTREMQRLKAGNRLGERVTVIAYSYAAIVFREAVITAPDRTIFSDDSLIQLVPTAGGSHLAWAMQFCPFEFFMGMFSSMSVAEDPYGTLARRLWEGEGNAKFYDVIKPRRMQTILVEGDSHSLARVRNKKVQRRYKNGIGENVTIIPKGTGVVHDYFPTEPAALEYLRRALDWPLAGAEPAGKPAVHQTIDLASAPVALP